MTSHPIGPEAVEQFVETIAGEDLHAKRVLSLANAVLGVIRAGALAVHLMGLGLAMARDLDRKHATKQVDRLLSNRGIEPWSFFASWVPYVIGDRKEIVVAMDWTEFDKDDQSTLCIYLVTERGRATPLLWISGYKSKMKGQQRDFVEDLLARLKEVLPPRIERVTVLADRGFGDIGKYALLSGLGFDYVIRFRGDIRVESESGSVATGAGWVQGNGRATMLRGPRVTNERYQVGAAVFVQKRGMKEPWCLASSRVDLRVSEIVKLYGRRFTIEETFRDTKDPRYGFGLSATHVKSTDRRDRLLLVAAIAHELLTKLGEAGEQLGYDRMLKVNTVKRRVHSFFTQGWAYYQFITVRPDKWVKDLIEKFVELLAAAPPLAAVAGAR